MSIDDVRAVIDRVKQQGFAAFTPRVLSSRYADVTPTPANLDGATLPNGAPLPATWREWLAFDGAWLMQHGWFTSLDPLTWAPRSLHDIASKELGRMWAQYYPKQNFDHCFLLSGGSDSRRVLVLTPAPDDHDEHPVLWLDVDDMPAMGVWMPGLDLYLAWAAGLTEEPPAGNRTYSDWAKLPFAKARSAHHVKHLMRGEWDMEFPNRLDEAPKRTPARPAKQAKQPAKKPAAKKPAAKKPAAKRQPAKKPAAKKPAAKKPAKKRAAKRR